MCQNNQPAICKSGVRKQGRRATFRNVLSRPSSTRAVRVRTAGADYQDVLYPSADGRLHLYARDYGAPRPRLFGQRPGALPVLCLHGLTRNSADFHDLASRLSRRYRVISVDQRGRGRSQWDPDPVHYNPMVYVQDMLALMARLGLDRVVVIGTSMGGLMAMIMGMTQRGRIAGAVINDVGPEIDPAGLARIASYAGKRQPVTTWAEAAEQTRQTNAVAFPDYRAADWMAFARRLYVEDADGRPVLAYDPAIAGGLTPTGGVSAAAPDLWPMWDALEGLPMLAIRGALSDLLAPATLDSMKARHKGLATAVVPRVGHAPMLDEPVAAKAIDRFLSGVRS